MHTEPLLLTPGPLTTSAQTKRAMLRDWGSWDVDFNQLTADIGAYLLACANATETHVCVPMQGSGTFAVEATLGTLIAPTSKTLVLSNGAYGQRMETILQYLQRPTVVLPSDGVQLPSSADIEHCLRTHPDIAQVAVVHCETSSGMLNPLEEIAALAARYQKHLIIDSMSAFGAVPIDAQKLPFAALVSSANKCFEGVPGFGFVLVERQLLSASAGQSHSLAMDLYDQWQYMQRTGQWRFTPPTHVVAAFHTALEQHRAEGGVPARHARYARNRDRLVEGLRQQGFATLLSDAWLSPIITTFLSPTDPRFTFSQFYALIKAQGFLIYPGKLTTQETFRIGHIGQLHDADIDRLLTVVASALDTMGITQVTQNTPISA
ncbi:2-aminoethylphosphonate--pyruvate transaminase [Salinispirillum sp. LH 10-3-1]|uniref:2-aminoethylphosphonate--pyruvate transaminase n=1 Tax=Salinispirillum sp. LH 10-3-1 TaxID=2952525 RepID=A0AB38YIS3_9GAMM